jgi:hypothetical protein
MEFFQSTVVVSTSSSFNRLHAVLGVVLTLEHDAFILDILNKGNTVYSLKYSNHTNSNPPMSLMHAPRIASGQLYILLMHMHMHM